MVGVDGVDGVVSSGWEVADNDGWLRKRSVMVVSVSFFKDDSSSINGR